MTHLSTIVCVIPSIFFLALVSLSWSSPPPTTTKDVTTFNFSRISSTSSTLLNHKEKKKINVNWLILYKYSIQKNPTHTWKKKKVSTEAQRYLLPVLKCIYYAVYTFSVYIIYIFQTENNVHSLGSLVNRQNEILH